MFQTYVKYSTLTAQLPAVRAHIYFHNTANGSISNSAESSCRLPKIQRQDDRVHWRSTDGDGFKFIGKTPRVP